MQTSNPAVICLSGGLDSTSLMLHLLAQNRTVYGLSFDYGQKHKVELDRLQANLEYLAGQNFKIHWKLIDLSTVASLLHSALTDSAWSVPEGHYESESMKQTVVPNRNAIFASIAFAHALSLSQTLDAKVDLCLGVHSGDHAIYPDCTPGFYNALFRAFEIGNWNANAVSFYLPYLDLNKRQILEDARNSVQQLKLDFETIFRNTITSYSPDSSGRSDGLTGSDVERILAFHELGLTDPIEYVKPWPQIVEQALEVELQFRSQQNTS